MSTFFNLPPVNERVVLLTHFVVREDAQILFGFLTDSERSAFKELVKISGVGPRTALSRVFDIFKREGSGILVYLQEGTAGVPGGQRAAEDRKSVV